jgi:nitrate/nitrite transporter NarK
MISLVSMEVKPLDEVNASLHESQFQWSNRYVVLMLICTLTLAAYVPFLDNVSKFYQERFGWTHNKAGKIVMLGYIIAALSSPLIGWVSDTYVAYKPQLIVLSTFLFLAAHLQFFLLKKGTSQYPNQLSVFGLVTLGLGYAFYSSVLIPAL